MTIDDYVPALTRLLAGIPEEAPCPVCAGWLPTESGPRGGLAHISSRQAEDDGADWQVYQCPRCGVVAYVRHGAGGLEVTARDAGGDAERAADEWRAAQG